MPLSEKPSCEIASAVESTSVKAPASGTFVIPAMSDIFAEPFVAPLIAPPMMLTI